MILKKASLIEGLVHHGSLSFPAVVEQEVGQSSEEVSARALARDAVCLVNVDLQRKWLHNPAMANTSHPSRTLTGRFRLRFTIIMHNKVGNRLFCCLNLAFSLLCYR